MRRCLGDLLLVLYLGLSPPGAASRLPSSAQDLQYGEVLFHFYQQDYFNSIVRLQIARLQERLVHHGDEAELLPGGLDLPCGLPAAAYPVQGPIDVVRQRVTGILNEDLRCSALRSMELDRTARHEAAFHFSWAAASRQFLNNPVPVDGVTHG